jgi:ligand-binding sensor domain-containing protein
VNEKPTPPKGSIQGEHGKFNASRPKPSVVFRSQFEGHALALALGRRWFAATDAGLLMSDNEGRSWKGGALHGQKGLIAVANHGQTIAAASLHGVWYSQDEGEHWSQPPLPNWVSGIYSLAIAQNGTLWIGTREGALRWSPQSVAWEHVLNGLAAREIIWIRADGDLLLAASTGSQSVYVSRDQGQQWQAEADSGFEITRAAVQQGTLYLATRHHGLLARESLTSEQQRSATPPR